LSSELCIRFEQLARDFSAACRSLRRAPVFAFVVVLTISVGVGANAAVLGIIDTAFLRKLPVADPERLVTIVCGDTTRRSNANSPCSVPEFRDLQARRIAGLEALAGYTMTDFKLGGELAGLEPYGALVTGNYFATLGVRATMGRTLLADEESPGDHPVVVVSDYFWRNTLGADAAAIGRKLVIGTAPFTIVGIMAPGFTGVHPEGRTDFWVPIGMQLAATGREVWMHRDARILWPVGRMERGATLAQLSGSLAATSRDTRERYPQFSARVDYRARLHDRLVSWRDVPTAAVTFVLAWAMLALLHLVACSNVASLLLARAAARRRELGIRLCLGASRARIVMQSLAEPFLLALLGAVGGIVLARWLTGLITSMQFMSAMDAGLDARGIALAIALAAGTALLVGLTPALVSARRDPAEILRGAAPGSNRSRDMSSAGVIVVQMALSIILLAQTALLLGKYRRESQVDIGFDGERLVMANLALKKGRPRSEWASAYDFAIDRLRGAPGMLSVSAAGTGPLTFGGGWLEPIRVQLADGATTETETSILLVGPGYFAAIGAALAGGREFTTADRFLPGSRAFRAFDGAVVNEAFVRRHFAGDTRSALGRTIQFRKAPAPVIGIVRDIRDVRLSGVQPRVYFPMLQWPSAGGNFTVVARVAGDAQAGATRVHSALAGLEMFELPTVRTIAAVKDDQLLIPKVLGLAMAGCAGLALLLTAIGLFGIVSMWAAERRTEIGIRLALGATSRHVYETVLYGIGRLAAAALLVGIVGAMALGRVERAAYGPSLSADAWSMIAGAGVFLLAVGLAAAVPARRATVIPPAEVLRSA
jgi:putative ABC transport system permease protein